MKKRYLSLLATLASFAVVGATVPVHQAHAADVINIKIANFFPPPSGQSKVTQAFGEELEKRSGGRIKVQYFAGGSLLAAPAMFKGIETGITDIGYSHVYYTPGRMPVTELLGLPLGVPSAWVGAHMAQDFYDKFQPKEFGNVRVLALHDNAPSLLITKKPVAKLEDLKGLSIRAPGMPGEIIKALGGTPTPTPMMETYDSILKGVNDGVWGPYETLRTFRFAEAAKNVTVCWEIGASFPFYLAMNKNTYNKLPKDLQELVDTLGKEYQEKYAMSWNDIDLAGKAFAAEKGVNFIELSEQEGTRWEKAMEPVIADYVKQMVGKGHSEAEVKGWIAFMRERIKYWTAKQIEQKIVSPTGPAGMRPGGKK